TSIIFLSRGVVCILNTPPGRQREVGSSFPFSAIRALTRSSAHGRYGKPPLRPQPASRNCCPKGMSWQPSTGQGLFSSAAQIPERSGLPSDILGVGACRFGDPSDVLGTPAVGYFTHCAAAGTDIADKREATTATSIRVESIDFLVFERIAIL